MGAVASVLIVDNNPADVRLTQDAFGNSKLHIDVVVREDGEGAIEYLSCSRQPDLILLELDLPGMSGQKLLGALKSDAALKMIPAIVFTASRSLTDIRDAYDKHANCFITKPSELDEFVKTIRAIEEFWLEHANLPNRETMRAALAR